MSKSFSLIWSLEGQTRKKKSLFGKLISYYFSAWYLFCFQVELLCGCSASSFFPLQSESLQMKIRYLDAFSSILNTTLNFPSDWTWKWMKLQRKKNPIKSCVRNTLLKNCFSWKLMTHSKNDRFYFFCKSFSYTMRKNAYWIGFITLWIFVNLDFLKCFFGGKNQMFI